MRACDSAQSSCGCDWGSIGIDLAAIVIHLQFDRERRVTAFHRINTYACSRWDHKPKSGASVKLRRE
jgi:hypothetical protein